MPGTYTYEDGARREDLLDIITNIDPTENGLLEGLGTSTAKDILHQYPIDTLKTVGANAYVEGVDACYADRTDPTRLFNYTQIVQIGFQVSDTEREVNAAGFNDRYQYEGTKALKEWRNDAEFALMRGSLACGNSSTARSLRGLKNSLSLVTSQSGVSLSETMLNDYFANVWTATGTQVDTVYAGIYLKRKISGFTGSASQKTVPVSDKRLTAVVDVYESDAASMVRLVKHRYATIAGDVNYDIVGIDSEKFKVAYLRKPITRELAKTGDATNGQVIGELTLEARHYNAGFFAQRHL